MLEDIKRAGENDSRQQREAAEKAARDRAQASLAQLNLQSQGSWGGQPQNYPPAPSWQQASPPTKTQSTQLIVLNHHGCSPPHFVGLAMSCHKQLSISEGWQACKKGAPRFVQGKLRDETRFARLCQPGCLQAGVNF